MIEIKVLNQLHSRIRWNPFLFFLRREIHRFCKVFFQTVFIPVANSSLYLVIFGVSLGSQLDSGTGGSYLEFIIPGLVMMSCLTNAFQNGSSSILSLKFGGDIIDIKASPLTTRQTLWALGFGGAARGIFVGGIVFGVGQLFHFWQIGGWLSPYSVLALIFFAVSAGLVFSKLGAAVALWAKTFDHIGAVGGLVLAPLTYLGGVFFSLDMLSPFWRSASLFNPMLYFINGIRWSILGHSDVALWVCAAVSLASLAFFHFLCLFAMNSDNYRRW